jgi:hypothetical protein
MSDACSRALVETMGTFGVHCGSAFVPGVGLLACSRIASYGLSCRAPVGAVFHWSLVGLLELALLGVGVVMFVLWANRRFWW